MGFPRILSKNNTIYTKLGEFCLSIDGNQFYILCHTCQQELQTQDNFWKHIQDEHSFMHELKRENSEDPSMQQNQSFMDSSKAVVVDVAPPPAAALVSNYSDVKIKIEHDLSVHNVADEENKEGEPEPKDYTAMSLIEPNAVEVNIKVEEPHISDAEETTEAEETKELQQAPTTLYIPPNADVTDMPPHITSFASILQNMAEVCAAMPPSAAKDMSAVEVSKDSSSVTSEDGERWYICGFHTCGFKFKYQSHLVRHRQVHSEVRSYVCELCNASFRQSCNLSTHRRKKHNIKPLRSRFVNCDSCDRCKSNRNK